MNIARWLRTLAVTALVATACASSPAATKPGTSAGLQSPCRAVQPAPQFAASKPSNSNLVLGKLRGSIRTVVRDVTDVTHPKTLSTHDITSLVPRFVTATDVSYVDRGYLVRLGLSDSSTSPVAACAGIFDWSPDGTAVVYLSQSISEMAQNQGAVHLVSRGLDRGLGSTLNMLGGGCEGQSCADNRESRLSYSPDGAYIALIYNASQSLFRVWKSDGTLLSSMDTERRTMSAWSGKGLYFRDDKGVEVWRDGVVSSFLPGVQWIRPKASPGGGQIVYAARDTTGLAHTYLVDTSTAKVREIAKGRAEPAFLTPTLIWYQEERLCTSNDRCQLGPTVLTGTTYIYDLQDSTETESRITSVADVWPHPA